MTDQAICSVEDILVETRKSGVSDKMAMLIMCCLFGAESKEIAPIIATLLINVVEPKVVQEETKWEEMETYHPGFVALLHDCAVAIHADVLKNFQVRKIIDDCWSYPYVGYDVVQYVRETGMLDTVEGDALDAILDEVIAANEKAVKEIKAGKDKAIGALVGQVMKKQKVDPAVVKEKLFVKLRYENKVVSTSSYNLTLSKEE